MIDSLSMPFGHGMVKDDMVGAESEIFGEVFGWF